MSETYTLRPYQTDAIKHVFHEWKEGNKKTLLVLPTGTGKTIVFARIAQIAVEHHQRVLILAHRQELLQQAKDKIYHSTGLTCAIEKAEQTAVGTSDPIVIASMQTLQNESRLHQYQPSDFQVIIIDEAHHVLSPSYQKILSYFHQSFVLGVTATATRGDQKELGQYFDSLAYEYSLSNAVNDGYLSPMKAMTIPLKIDISKVSFQAGDYQVGELGHALEPYLDQIVQEMRNVCMERKTIVFLPLIHISQKFCELCNQNGFSAIEVNGTTPNRNEIIQDFQNGKYNVLCNSMLLTEGFDCPDIDCVIVLRPTSVSGLYRQMIGRGTRLAPNKKDLLILDFLWMSAKHELCHPASLTDKPDDVIQAIVEKAQDGHLYDIEEESEEMHLDILAQRKKKLALELQKQRDKQRRILNPLEVGLMLNDSDIVDYEPMYRSEITPPTQKQLDSLANFGMDPSTIETKGQATILIRKLIHRAEKNLCTLKQIRFLDSKGFKNVHRWSFADARDMMDTIAKNQWNVPKDIDISSYKPASLQRKRKKKTTYEKNR